MIFIYNLLSKSHFIFFFKQLSSYHNFDKKTSIVIWWPTANFFLRFLSQNKFVFILIIEQLITCVTIVPSPPPPIPTFG